MRTTALLIAFLPLVSCSFLSADSDAAALVKANSARTKKFHELNDKVTAAQAVLSDYLTGEVKKCDAEGKLHPPAKGMKMQLHFSPQGADLVCDAQPDLAQQQQPQPQAQQSKPQTPVPPPPPPAEKKP